MASGAYCALVRTVRKHAHARTGTLRCTKCCCAPSVAVHQVLLCTKCFRAVMKRGAHLREEVAFIAVALHARACMARCSSSCACLAVCSSTLCTP